MAFVGLDEHPKLCRADDLREAEAADVAATVQKAVTEGWSVRDDDLYDWRRFMRSRNVSRHAGNLSADTQATCQRVYAARCQHPCATRCQRLALERGAYFERVADFFFDGARFVGGRPAGFRAPRRR